MNNNIFLLVIFVEFLISFLDNVLIETVIFGKSDFRLVSISNNNNIGVSDGKLMSALVFNGN